MKKNIKEEYEDAESLVRQKMKENPELAESDTKLVLEIISEASGIFIPLSPEEIPAIGTITRASRKVRKEEEIEKLVSDTVEQERQEKEKSTSLFFSE